MRARAKRVLITGGAGLIGTNLADRHALRPRARRGVRPRRPRVPPVEFHSPYGYSKGCADQYVLDYARTFRLPAAVFRMSCGTV